MLSTCFFVILMALYLLPSLRILTAIIYKIGMLVKILRNDSSKTTTFKIIPFEYILLPLLVPSFYFSYLNVYFKLTILESLGIAIAIIPFLYLSIVLCAIFIMSIYSILKIPFRRCKLKKILFERKNK